MTSDLPAPASQRCPRPRPSWQPAGGGGRPRGGAPAEPPVGHKSEELWTDCPDRTPGPGRGSSPAAMVTVGWARCLGGVFSPMFNRRGQWSRLCPHTGDLLPVLCFLSQATVVHHALLSKKLDCTSCWQTGHVSRKAGARRGGRATGVANQTLSLCLGLTGWWSPCTRWEVPGEAGCLLPPNGMLVPPWSWHFSSCAWSVWSLVAAMGWDGVEVKGHDKMTSNIQGR